MTTLSVVIPIKDERNNLRPLHDRLRAALEPLRIGQTAPALDDYEILFIDDGSIELLLRHFGEGTADLRLINFRKKILNQRDPQRLPKVAKGRSSTAAVPRP